jgi:hypothetical protein
VGVALGPGVVVLVGTSVGKATVLVDVGGGAVGVGAGGEDRQAPSRPARARVVVMANRAARPPGRASS